MNVAPSISEMSASAACAAGADTGAVTRYSSLKLAGGMLNEPAAGSFKGNARSSGYERNANDFYVEPAWAVRAFLDAELFHGEIYDPACGTGTIPETCIAWGYHARGSDIADRGYGPVQDFFQWRGEAANIVSNPPFNLAERWVMHACAHATSKVAILQRLAFLESSKRAHLFDRMPFARVWVHRRRVSVRPGGSGVKASGGSIPYAWFVWDRAHSGPATVGWLP